jgi:hypothetical protein
MNAGGQCYNGDQQHGEKLLRVGGENLAILSIERELAEKLSFADVIKDFASSKARKANICA